MAGIDASAAAKIVASLDAELQRRQAKRDEAEDARWAEQVGGDEIILHARRLARNWDRISNKECPPALLTVEDTECLIEEVLKEAKQLFLLAADIDREEWRRDREEAGTLHAWKPVIITPRVRMPDDLGRESGEPKAKAGEDNGKNKGPRLSRTEVFRQQQQAELAARMAHLGPPAGGQQDAAAVWMSGVIRRYDSRGISGVVALGGAELPFSAAALLRHGPTTFSPGQPVDAEVTRAADGRLVVGEVKLSVGEKAKQLAELERRSGEAEERFKITFGMRRPLH